jgi:ATP-dependent RNA helicase DeaD
MDVGRRQKADPKWLLPMICRRGNVSRNEIGTIRILDDTTEFEISKEAAEHFAVHARKKDGDDIIIALASEAQARPDRAVAKNKFRDGKPFAEKKNYPARKPYAEAKAHAAPAPHVEKGAYEDRKPYQDRKPDNVKAPYQDRAAASEKKPFRGKPFEPRDNQPRDEAPRVERPAYRQDRPAGEDRPKKSFAKPFAKGFGKGPKSNSRSGFAHRKGTKG